MTGVQTCALPICLVFSTIHFKSAGRTATLSCELGLRVFSTGSIGSTGSTDSILHSCCMFRDHGYKSSILPNPLPPDRVIVYPVLPSKYRCEFMYLFCIAETDVFLWGAVWCSFNNDVIFAQLNFFAHLSAVASIGNNSGIFGSSSW